MKRYVVTNTILSRAEGATPADVTYYRGEDPMQALVAVGQAMTLCGDDTSLPRPMQFDVTGVRLDIFEVADPEPEPGTLGAAQAALPKKGDQS